MIEIELDKYEKENYKKHILELSEQRENIVLNDGYGKIINNLYKKWTNIKTKDDSDSFKNELLKTKFGTYGTLQFHEVLNNFNPTFKNEIIKNHFLNETKKILKKSGEMK